MKSRRYGGGGFTSADASILSTLWPPCRSGADGDSTIEVWRCQWETVERTSILIPRCPIEIADDKRPVNFVLEGPMGADWGLNGTGAVAGRVG